MFTSQWFLQRDLCVRACMRACVRMSRLQTKRQEGHNGATLRAPSSPFFFPFFLLREILCPSRSLFTPVPAFLLWRTGIHYTVPSILPLPNLLFSGSLFTPGVSLQILFTWQTSPIFAVNADRVHRAHRVHVLDSGERYFRPSVRSRSPKFRNGGFLLGTESVKSVEKTENCIVNCEGIATS